MSDNFWYKHLTCVHPVLAKYMQNIILNPELASFFMLEGITYMLPKKPDSHSPSGFGPIAYLSNICKFLTAVISDNPLNRTLNNTSYRYSVERDECELTKETAVFDITLQFSKHRYRIRSGQVSKSTLGEG